MKVVALHTWCTKKVASLRTECAIKIGTGCAKKVAALRTRFTKKVAALCTECTIKVGTGCAKKVASLPLVSRTFLRISATAWNFMLKHCNLICMLRLIVMCVYMVSKGETNS